MLLGFAPNLILAWAAAAGICAGILGYRTWAAYLITPAVITFVLWPLLAPFATALLTAALAHWWWLVPLLLIAPIVAVILGMRLLIAILTFLFGTRVAGHVGGVLTTRLIDRITGRQQGRPIPQWEHDENA